MLYFAVKGTFEQVFVRCHQFHFRILLSKKGYTWKLWEHSLQLSSETTDLFYERLNNVNHTILLICMKALLQADIF